MPEVSGNVSVLCESMKEYLRYSLKNNLDDSFMFSRASIALANVKGVSVEEVHRWVMEN